MIGRSLAHYRIVEKLGEGGMGVVYKALDTHLDRFIALKVLPAEKVADPDRKRRFVQEAKAASALNHPNIITVHDVGEAEGVTFIAMEYVEGQTLDQLIGHKGLKLADLLKLAIQVAGALAKAHEAGIVHRDLKPSNIMVTSDGLVKVLDFGLAKLTERAGSELEATRTLETVATKEGTIVGTAAYMSPEQAEGKPVDARSDIFSFGAVLYEMVTGRRAFGRESAASTLAAVLREDPLPVSQIAGQTPRDFEKILARCLRKDPARRFQHMDDVKVALEELKEESDSGALTPAAPPPLRRGIPVWAACAAAAALAVAAAAWFFLGRSGRVGPPPKVGAVAARAGIEWAPALSPDGKQIAYVWNGEKQDNDDIYVQLLDEGTPRRLTTDPAFDFSPVWSPDGLRIAFLRQTPEGTEVRIIPSAGGAERRVYVSRVKCSYNLKALAAQFCGLSWSPDGKFLAIADQESQSSTAVFLLDIETRQTRKLTSPKSPAYDGRSVFSPDGRRLAFARSQSAGWPTDIYILPLSEAGEPRGEPRPVTRDKRTIFGFDWTPDGREIVFSSDRAGHHALWHVPVSGGEPERLTVGSENCGWPAVSRKGNRLAYVQLTLDYNIWRVAAPGSGASDPPLRITHSPFIDVAPAVSPDNAKVAFTSNVSGAFQVWICGIDGSQQARFASTHGFHAQWSSDGRQIVFASGRERTGDVPFLYRVGAEGGVPTRLTEGDFPEHMPAWSRDGRFVYFMSLRGNDIGVWKVPATGGLPVLVARGGSRPIESYDGLFLYYFGSGAQVWKVPVAGGKPVAVLKTGRGALFTISKTGVYVLDPDAGGGPVLEFTAFEGGRSQALKLGGEPDSFRFAINSLAVSPDGHWAFYSHLDRNEGDVMLVENFR